NIEAKILKANCLAENKDNSYEAIMEDITSKTYDDANILVGIAEVYETAGNYEQALAYYEEALKIKDDINIKSYMIQCYIDLQDYENAINLCDEIIDKDPNNMDALEKKIFSLNELEKYNEAVDLANNSLKINTSYAVFYYELYYAYFNLDDYDLSLANINKYIELNPDEAEGYLYRAKLEKELGDTSNVEQDMQVYIAKGGDKEKGDVFLND
ncbi:MAG: tetratricopeptide repeat protein, partial [Oscillospiraceae bacterium]|nr:tetratricopeptide repeat protein [Oscillospiraceae bacterium]